jgi:hypothetical protein
MLIEVLIPIGCALMVCFDPKNPGSWILVVIIFFVWQDMGGFAAWNKKNRIHFIENMKKIGPK